jgi:molecular chaperone HscB
MSSLLKQNYFELFGFSPAYELDTNKLAARYRELQQVVHPDRFAAASEQDRRLSLQSAAHINEAFQTLKLPLSRARYLLELRGVSADQAVAPDGEFLAEQMNLREQLDELLEQTEPLIALMHMRDDVESRLRQLQQEFADSLAADNNEQAAQIFNKMQFLVRLCEELDNREERLSD